jgi:hypothetical protein
MAESPKTKSIAPAYVSYKTFQNLTRSLTTNGNLPSKIDQSLFSSMSGSVKQQFLRALRFFELTDDAGTPNPRLRELANAKDDAAWRAAMGPLIRERYQEQIPLLETGTPNQLRDSFGDIGGIVTPVMRFFLAACLDCGIEVSHHNSKTPTTRKRRVSRTENSRDIANGPIENANPIPTLFFTGPQQSVIQALLNKFPPFDTNWSEKQQQSWFAAYEKLLSISETKKGGSE